MHYQKYYLSNKWLFLLVINVSILLDMLTTLAASHGGFGYELNPFFRDINSLIIANLFMMIVSSLIFLWVYPDESRLSSIRNMSYKELIGINFSSSIRSIADLFKNEDLKSVMVYTMLALLLANSFVKIFAALNNVIVILTGYGFAHVLHIIGSLISIEFGQETLYFSLYIFSFTFGFLLSFFGAKKYI